MFCLAGPRPILAHAAIGLGLALLAGVAARAEPVERNLPPPPPVSEATIAAPPLPSSINDDRALGASLSAIVILGPTTPASAGPLEPGVQAEAVPRLNRRDARGMLKRFLGRPISRKLISQIETAIVREYRRQGFPFVEVSTPEQEITSGVLQIRVVEFHVAQIAVTHAGKGQAADIGREVRIRPGDDIDSRLLLQDLDWLNRYPYRTVAPIFTPGAALGETDLDFAVTPMRPWSVYGGYANSGSPLTGEDRYFVGGGVSGHLLTDTAASVQITGSPDFWATQGKPFANRNPQYESAAGRLQIATAPREDIELTIDAVETNEPNSPFVLRQQTLEATLGYRSALSDFAPLPGDIALGVEVSRQVRDTVFGGVVVLNPTIDIYQLYEDWSDRWSDRFGSTSLDLSVHSSPGHIDSLNTDAVISAFTSGRVSRAVYAYAQANLTRQTGLPLGFNLLTQFNGQIAGMPIPDSQQIALGGQSAVRGYSIDDGAWDNGVVLRDEVHAPVLPVIRGGLLASSFAPMVFVDYGFGQDEATRSQVNMASVGFGADLRLKTVALASIDLSYPLIDARFTRAGDVHLDARLTFAY